MRRATACLAALLHVWTLREALHATEAEETRRSSFEAFLQGRLEDASSGYRYLAALGVDHGEATVNQALLARDAGNPEEALALWVKASLLASGDAFIWNQRGWAYLAVGRAREAQDAFSKAVEVSSSAVWTAEGMFGLAMAQESDSSLKASVASYLKVSVLSPTLFPAVAGRLGEVAVRMRRLDAAETYFRQSVHQDPRQPAIMRGLAEVYEKENLPKAAWMAYKSVLDLDASDARAVQGFDRTVNFLLERPERLLPVRRLVAPLLRKPVPPPDSPMMRVGLYSNLSGQPAFARRVFLMSGSDFRVVDLKLGEVNRGKADDQWELILRPESGVVELRDPHRQLQYVTKQPFRLEPADRGATVLLKSAELLDMRGVDLGDREVRGRVEVLPTPYGFQLINELGVEEYLYGQVASAVPEGAPEQALRAQALLSRTRVLALFPPGERQDSLGLHACDSSHCSLYAGLAQESSEATRAVLDTMGGVLVRGGGKVPASQHLHCGWATEDSGEDRADPAQSLRSARDLERLVHQPPERDSYDEAASLLPASAARWVRVLQTQAVRARVERRQYIGKLHNLRVLRRSPTGRILALEAVGAQGRLAFEGEEAVRALLYPGGLPSTLFTLQPLYRGKELRQVLLWGAGTGNGKGLCLAGALGRARLGMDARAILSHYFPGSTLAGLLHPDRLAAPRSVRPGNAAAATGADPWPERKDRAAARRALREELKRKARGEGGRPVDVSSGSRAGSSR